MKLSIVFLGLFFTQFAFGQLQWNAYSDSAFEKAKASGQYVILGFHKIGCGSCQAQDNALSQAGLQKAPNTVLLKVERTNRGHDKVYESYGFGKRTWGHVIVYKGQKEITRLNPGEKEPEKVNYLVGLLK